MENRQKTKQNTKNTLYGYNITKKEHNLDKCMILLRVDEDSDEIS